MIAPPKDVGPASLFRILLGPTPTRQLDFRFPFSRDVALYARPLHYLEWCEVDDLPACERGAAALSLGLCDEHGSRLFACAEEAKSLTARELEQASASLGRALAVIGPTYKGGRFDIGAWMAKLKLGAEALRPLVSRLGSCLEVHGKVVVERPEWYYGISRSELLDGHWMAYRAALAVYLDDVKRRDNESK